MSDTAVEIVRARVLPWLEDTRYNPNRLEKWLNGIGLGAVGSETQPYEWLLRSLPLGADRSVAASELAARTARLLSRNPSDRLLGLGAEKAVYNALALAAGLADGEQLAEALQAILRERALDGDYEHSNLRAELRVALILNQVDDALLRDWWTMLLGQSHDYLPGTWIDGLEGILRVRPSFEKRDQPVVVEIGRALAKAADWLAAGADREVRFARILGKVERTWPMKWDFRTLAKQCDWPDWAVRPLPVETSDDEVTPDMPAESLAKACVVGALWSYGFEQGHSLIDGDSHRLIELVDEVIERHVRRDPSKTRQSRIGAEQQALQEIADDLRHENRDELARVVENASEDLLRKARVMAS